MAELVAARVERTAGRISAKRLLPVARAAGYVGSARNFRRLVAEAKSAWRRSIIGAGVRRCGHPVRYWLSTGGPMARCSCSARCWPGSVALRAFRRR